jgi:hypothetical protein
VYSEEVGKKVTEMPIRVMAIKYKIEPTKGVILTTVSGSVSVEDIITYLGEVFPHPKRGQPYREIFDLRDADMFGVDMEGARQIAAFVEGYRSELESGMVALVAPRDFEFGMGRVIGAYLDELPFDFRVFRDSKDARAWIGLD